MGTRLKRRRKTRAEKIAASKGKMPERLRDYLNIEDLIEMDP